MPPPGNPESRRACAIMRPCVISRIMRMIERLTQYALLMRLHRPIGAFLLLWPTLWALWFAAGGLPEARILIVFVVGVFLTRSAGCVINDYADREFDPHVGRPRNP